MGRAQPPTRQRMGPATTSRGEAQLSLRELRDEVSGVPPAMSCHDKCRSANGTKTQWVNVGDVIPKKNKNVETHLGCLVPQVFWLYICFGHIKIIQN